MSNLYKHYNTMAMQNDVRMMDYNSMIEKKLAELAKQQQADSNQAEDGFRSLDAVAQEPVREDPEEVLQKAKDEAEALRNQAKEEANRLIEDAKEQSKEVLLQAKEAGSKEGYEAGYAQIKEELETEYAKRQEELEQLKQIHLEEYDQKLKNLEPELLDVILTVVERVFHIQFGDKKEILLYLAGNTIANIEGCKSFRIRVGNEQKSFLEDHKDEILDRIGHDMSIEIVSDLSLEGSQCIIETDTGIFDCSLGVQLENLIKDLRSLSSRG